MREVRCGVPMSALKARIFDNIKRGGRNGIDTDILFGIVFDGRKATKDSLKSHIQQINDRIEDEGWRIVGKKGRGGNYRLVKQCA